MPAYPNHGSPARPSPWMRLPLPASPYKGEETEWRPHKSLKSQNFNVASPVHVSHPAEELSSQAAAGLESYMRRNRCRRTRNSNGRRVYLGNLDFDLGGRRALVAARRPIDRGHGVDVAPA